MQERDAIALSKGNNLTQKHSLLESDTVLEKI